MTANSAASPYEPTTDADPMFECLTDEPDFAAMTGLARGIRWSDVLADIEADNQRREMERRRAA